ncbi:MAG: hypothetical protein IIB38_02585 [Candidatus Hydrogenedentes bacterium]|nr:hypothetical protein [Candidatus Hydrogenedentota bacterium]
MDPIQHTDFTLIEGISEIQLNLIHGMGDFRASFHPRNAREIQTIRQIV